jgi:glycogen debranching enzyme
MSMIRLKEGRTYLVADRDGQISGNGCGLYRHDTRLLAEWLWTREEAVQLSTDARDNWLSQHFALIDVRKTQIVGLTRSLSLSDTGLRDTWTVHNSSRESQRATLRLSLQGDFRDVFQVWARKPLDGSAPVTQAAIATGLSLSRTATDGAETVVAIAVQPPSPDLFWALDLEPGQTQVISVDLHIIETLDEPATAALPDREAFSGRVAPSVAPAGHAATLARALGDLRTLLLPTQFGPYPAAGLPNFVNVFGRDALITTMMLGPAFADISEAVLRLLAHHQGRVVDPYREEEPGKILHEIRRGEASRTGAIPFGRYYGSIDATPLFIMALEAHASGTEDAKLEAELAPAMLAALDWLVGQQADDGLVRFAPSGSGLAVQSWKDSHDSMNHADGREAQPPLAVAEVQGYAFAAFQAAANLLDRAGDAVRAADCRARAQRLAARFHDLFWLDDLGTYAMALDRDGAPLRVHSSDPGHLLWCGIVPPEIAPTLVATMMSPALWSGWGLRTLGSGEVRYNPVSYHNGGVWPHDTALFGWGLHRYGFTTERDQVAAALFDLAAASPGGSMPELVSGFDRVRDRKPVAYTHACAPQAWSAAGLILMARLGAAGS